MIVPKTGKSFIPVVVTPEGEALQDTCDIIDALERRHPERPILPSDALLRFASLLMEYYADECLIYPGLHMRWHYEENREWVVPEFARSTDPTSPAALAADGAGSPSVSKCSLRPSGWAIRKGERRAAACSTA